MSSRTSATSRPPEPACSAWQSCWPRSTQGSPCCWPGWYSASGYAGYSGPASPSPGSASFLSPHESARTCTGLPGCRAAPTTGQGLHCLLDTGDVPFDVLHVQPSSDNLAVSDLEQRDPAHRKGLPVAACARPAPFGPGRVTVLDRLADLGVEVRDPREHGLPVGAHLRPPDEGPARVRRLLAAVVLMEETSRSIEIMCVHGHDQPVNHFGHQIPRGP